MKKKLSFCIPTYNRAKYIGETLDTLVSVANPNIEIIIVDGASTDNTEEIVTKYTSQYEFIRYWRGEKNMGVDRDMSKSVELATGEYCWLMPSDDILIVEAIDRVMKILDQDHDLVVMNFRIKNEDLTTIIKDKMIDIDEDRVFSNKESDDFFRLASNVLTYMGSVIIKRDFWINRDRERYFDTDFIHVGIIFQEKFPGTTCFVAEPTIINRLGNATWSSRSFQIWAFRWPSLIWSFDSYSAESKKLICKRYPWKSCKHLVVQRAGGAFTIMEFMDMIVPINGALFAKIRAFLILFLPKTLLNLLLVLYCRVFSGTEIVLFNLKCSKFYWKRILKIRRLKCA